jgi:integrase
VIVKTGATFNESDERRAVARFRRWEAEQQRESIAELSIPLDAFESQAGLDAAFEGGATLQVFWDGSQRVGLEASEPALFAALWDHVHEDRLSAWLLCILNPCLYPGEMLSLDWGEVDLQKGTVVTSRSKTNVIRIGVLWPRTITALKAIWTNEPKREAPIFLSKRGGRLSINMVSKEFRTLRRASGVAEYVKAEHCRDGAYTAAIEAGVALTQANLLAGHATGISDHYAKRRPTMVSDAIKAIEKAYFGSSASRSAKHFCLRRPSAAAVFDPPVAAVVVIRAVRGEQRDHRALMCLVRSWRR